MIYLSGQPGNCAFKKSDALFEEKELIWGKTCAKRQPNRMI